MKLINDLCAVYVAKRPPAILRLLLVNAPESPQNASAGLIFGDVSSIWI